MSHSHTTGKVIAATPAASRLDVNMLKDASEVEDTSQASSLVADARQLQVGATAMPMPDKNLAYIEQALADGQISARMANGNFWQLRRNGKTQTWVTRPGEFRIPVKAGLHACGELTHRTVFGKPGDGARADFIINSMVHTANKGVKS